MDSYVDASILAATEMAKFEQMPSDYPTPASLDSTESAEPPKKKRKAWGQPVPPINPILPPRKRAKTAEEKEQRKNERILRNRKAADKSRQRQKAAVADLEKRQIEIEQENKQLKEILQQYQSQFGKLPGCEFSPAIKSETISPSTPVSLNDITSESFPQSSPTPVLSVSTPATSVYHHSPMLAPTLNLEESATFESSTNLSGMTQYPAVSAGTIGFEDSFHAATQHSIPDGLDFDPLSDDLASVFDENALADVPHLPDFSGNLVDSFHHGAVDPHSGQLQTDSYFDFDAYDTNATSGLSFETPQSTSRLQSQFSASS